MNELKKEYFRFEWLDNENLLKLKNSTNLKYYQPSFFKKGSFMHGGFTIISKTTILLRLYTM